MLKLETTKGSSVGADPLDTLLRPGSLATVFQPILELGDRGQSLWGVECLARGPAPFTDPREMFEYVRRRGAEVPMDRACVHAALRASAALPGSPRRSINVHARTLADDRRFTTYLLDELRRVGLPPRALTVEILAPRDLTPSLFDAIAQLRAVGIAIGIDDLGLSSTDYEGLVECQPDVLKIDPSLIRPGPHAEFRDEIFELVACLAQDMGALAVAEGVETAEQLGTVTRHGIRLVQGHLFAAPMTSRQLIATGLLRPAAPACG